MKRMRVVKQGLLCFLLAGLLLLLFKGAEAFLHSHSPITHKQELNSSKQELNSSETVVIASVRESMVKSVFAAFDKAGIDCFCYTDLGMAGVYVPQRDVVQAKAILKADAQAHHYKIQF